MGFFDTISSVFDSVSDQFSNYGNLVNNLVGGGSSNTGSMNDLATTLTSDKAPTTAAQPLLPRDDQWLRLSFILPADNGNNIPLNSDDLSNRSFSSASLKYTDTTPGGNLCINPPPQYTWYSDIHSTGYRGAGLDGVYEPSLNMKAGSAGMGRYYSESVDDSNQLIHMSFGVPEYNTLSAFFTGFYSIVKMSQILFKFLVDLLFRKILTLFVAIFCDIVKKIELCFYTFLLGLDIPFFDDFDLFFKIQILVHDN